MCGKRQRCHYKVLAVAHNASTADIVAAYRKRALEWRMEGDSWAIKESRERLQQIKEAFKVLSDVSTRAKYDANVSRQLSELGRDVGN